MAGSWELSDQNPLDQAARQKFRAALSKSTHILWGRDARRDLDEMPISYMNVLGAVIDALDHGCTVLNQYLDDGDLAFIVKGLQVCSPPLYFKAKFVTTAAGERLKVISCHPDRRW